MSQGVSPSSQSALPPAFSQAAAIRSGAGLVASTSADGGPGVDQLAGVEQIEIVLCLLGLRRGGQDDRVAGLLECLEQGAGALEGGDLADHLGVQLGLGLAHRVAVLLLDALAGHRGDELVPAHADVAVDAPQRHDHSDASKCPRPGDRVVVVAVDERPVDVDDDLQAAIAQAVLPRGFSRGLRRLMSTGTRAQGGPGAGNSPDGEGSARAARAACDSPLPGRAPPKPSQPVVSGESPAGRQAACRGRFRQQRRRGAGAAIRGLAGFAARAIVWLRFLIVPAWIALAVLASVQLPSISETGGGGVGSMVPKGSAAVATEESAYRDFGTPALSRSLAVLRDPRASPRRADPGDRLSRPAQPPTGTDRRAAWGTSRGQPEATAADAGERHRGPRAAVPRSGARHRGADGVGGRGLSRASRTRPAAAAPRSAAPSRPRPRDGRWSPTGCRWWRSSWSRSSS